MLTYGLIALLGALVVLGAIYGRNVFLSILSCLPSVAVFIAEAWIVLEVIKWYVND